MMRFGKYLILLLLMVGCGIIVIAPKRGKNDLSQNWATYQESPSLYRKVFIRVNAREAKTWAESKGEAVVAPWCPYSLSALRDGSYQTLACMRNKNKTMLTLHSSKELNGKIINKEISEGYIKCDPALLEYA